MWRRMRSRRLSEYVRVGACWFREDLGDLQAPKRLDEMSRFFCFGRLARLRQSGP